MRIVTYVDEHMLRCCMCEHTHPTPGRGSLVQSPRLCRPPAPAGSESRREHQLRRLAACQALFKHGMTCVLVFDLFSKPVTLVLFKALYKHEHILIS